MPRYFGRCLPASIQLIGRIRVGDRQNRILHYVNSAAEGFRVATLQDDQPPFDRAVCDAMVASTPDSWGVIVLTLERPHGVTAVGQVDHSLSSPEGHPPVMLHDSCRYTANFEYDQPSGV